MATYTDPEPASGAELISVSQPLITGNFTYLHESYGKDHNFTSTSNPSVLNSDGYHKVIHFLNQGGDPAPNTGGQLYTKTVSGTTQLFYENEVPTVTQLTGLNSSNAASRGYVWIGNILIQWGFVTTLATSGTVTFASGGGIAFPTNVFNISTTPYFNPGAPPSSSNPASYALALGTFTTAAFDWRLFSNSSSYQGFFWTAIGN